MQTNPHIPTDRAAAGQTDATSREEPLSQTALLLPVPDEEDVAGFTALYRKRYGVELEPEIAHEILGSLMRFLYLTRRRTEGPPSHLDR